MDTQLSWKKGFFSRTCRIFSENTEVGELRHKNWTNTTEGNLQGKRYLFKTSGFFHIKTRIIDIDYHVVVGEIAYGFWRTKATIEYDDLSYEWTYNNSWPTRWRITPSGMNLVD